MIDRRRRATPGAPDLIECLYCGDRLRSLGPHLYRVHQVSAAEYRVEHRLPATYPLMAESMRLEQSEQRKAAMEADPSITAGMIPGAHGDMIARSAEARAGTDDLPQVRAGRRRSAAAMTEAAAASRRQRMDERARAAGFESMADAIEQTRGMAIRDAAERIGVGINTIKRHR